MITREERRIRETKAALMTYEYYMERPEHKESLEFIRTHDSTLYDTIIAYNQDATDSIARDGIDSACGDLIIPLLYYRSETLYSEVGDIYPISNEERFYVEYVRNASKTHEQIAHTVDAVSDYNATKPEMRMPILYYTAGLAASMRYYRNDAIRVQHIAGNNGGIRALLMEISALPRRPYVADDSYAGILIDAANSNRSISYGNRLTVNRVSDITPTLALNDLITYDRHVPIIGTATLGEGIMKLINTRPDLIYAFRGGYRYIADAKSITKYHLEIAFGAFVDKDDQNEWLDITYEDVLNIAKALGDLSNKIVITNIPRYSGSDDDPYEDVNFVMLFNSPAIDKDDTGETIKILETLEDGLRDHNPSYVSIDECVDINQYAFACAMEDIINGRGINGEHVSLPFALATVDDAKKFCSLINSKRVANNPAHD